MTYLLPPINSGLGIILVESFYEYVCILSFILKHSIHFCSCNKDMISDIPLAIAVFTIQSTFFFFINKENKKISYRCHLITFGCKWIRLAEHLLLAAFVKDLL